MHARSSFVQSLEQAEERLDDEIGRLEKLDEDELERMRRIRMDKLKKINEQKQQWAQQVGDTHESSQTSHHTLSG